MSELSTVYRVFPEIGRAHFKKYIERPDYEPNSYSLSDIVKEYADMIQITIYHDSYTVHTGGRETRRAKKLEKRIDNTHRSARRSKQAIYDIVTMNDWDYWCTFTFNPKKVDRHDYNRVAMKMSLWLGRQKGLRYIVVPEYHKDGAVHFHALIAGYTGKLKTTKKRTKNGQKVFQGNFGSGWHEFVELDKNKDAIAKYMIKQYITKTTPKLFNRKRYWCSRGLDRPVSFINGLTRFHLWSLVKDKKPDYIDEHLEIHKIPKTTNFFTCDYQTSLLL